MSIFASLSAPDDDEHTDECARWEKQGGLWEISDRACDCGQPDSPRVYQGSHVLPSEDDERDGWVDIALIPPHVRFWRENPDADPKDEPDFPSPPDPYLRLGVGGKDGHGTVILTRRNVRQIHASLTEWLRMTERSDESA